MRKRGLDLGGEALRASLRGRKGTGILKGMAHCLLLMVRKDEFIDALEVMRAFAINEKDIAIPIYIS